MNRDEIEREKALRRCQLYSQIADLRAEIAKREQELTALRSDENTPGGLTTKNTPVNRHARG